MQYPDDLWVRRLSVGSFDIPDEDKLRACKREPREQPLNKNNNI